MSNYFNDFPAFFTGYNDWALTEEVLPYDECALAAAEYQAYLEKVDQDWTLLVEALVAAFAPSSPLFSDRAECIAEIDQQRDAAGTDPYAEHVAQRTSPMFFIEPFEFDDGPWGPNITRMVEAEVQGLAGIRIPYASEVTVHDEIDSCEQELFIDMYVHGTQDYREIMDIAEAEVEFAGYRSDAFNYVITPSQFGDRVVVEVMWT